jgi:hypothetical protein
VAGAAGPGLIAVYQPSTICHDIGFVQTPLGASVVAPLATGENGSGSAAPPHCEGWVFWSGGGPGWSWSGQSGPWNSFVGSTSSGGASLTWGPGIGWGLALAGVVLLGAGTLLAGKPRA